MEDEKAKALVNIGDLAKPITAFIERIAEFFGGALQPVQMKRLARAEVEVAKIKTEGKLEIDEIEQRGLLRLVRQEGKAQANVEAIAEKAIEYLLPAAQPEKLQDDWMSFFFERCKLVSNLDMQDLWARILAGEANNTGKHSRLTLNVLSMMDKQDAELFGRFCSFCWTLVDGSPVPVIFSFKDDIVKNQGVHFSSVLHLGSLGLVQTTNIGYCHLYREEGIRLRYFSTVVEAKYGSEERTSLLDQSTLPLG